MAGKMDKNDIAFGCLCGAALTVAVGHATGVSAITAMEAPESAEGISVICTACGASYLASKVHQKTREKG